MSDFDREAERERLREKYERDQQKREATEKMSELLLQGATMTNAHCSDCGDPIFRYEGQEFCASCEKAVDRDTADGDADGTDDAEAADADADDERIEVASPDETRVQFGGDADTDEAGDEPDQSRAQPDDSSPAEPPRQRRTVADRDPEPRADAETDVGRRQSRSPATTPGGGDLAETRAALQRTLRRLSQRAGECEDPREAEAYLAAAREAAETLAALRR